MFLTWPRVPELAAGVTVSDAQVLAITAKHCVACHSPHPTHEGIDQPPKGATLDTIEGIRKNGALALKQAVQTKVMPVGNETSMTDAERAELGAWILAHPQ